MKISIESNGNGGVIARFIIYALSHIADGSTIIEIHYSSGG